MRKRLEVPTHDDEPIIGVVDCSPSKVAKYTGRRRPRCNNGAGCSPCWKKYWEEHERKLNEPR